MSSRTAAGRKRIKQEHTNPSKEPKEGGFKALFSRSKSAAPQHRSHPPPPPASTYPSPPPSTSGLLKQNHDIPQHSTRNPPTSAAIRVYQPEAPGHWKAVDGGHSQPWSGLSVSPRATEAYPTPADRYRELSPKPSNECPNPQGYGGPQLLRKASSSSSTMFTSYDIQGATVDQFPSPPSHSFLRATYQPPPPPTRSRIGRPLPSNPTTGQALNASPYPPEKVPSPTSPHPTQLPSPSRSPVPFSTPVSPPLSEANFSFLAYNRPNIQSSLLLQPASDFHHPTSTSELPRYEGTPAHGSDRLPVQVYAPPIEESRYGDPFQNYGARRGSEGHTSPSVSGLAFLNPRSSPDVPRRILQPLRTHGADGGGGGGWHDSTTTDLLRQSASGSPVTSPRSANGTAQHPSGYADSVTSSGSSKQSSSEGSLNKNTPGFVFPGGRSTVKPKISSKTGKVKINVTGKKSKSQEPGSPRGSPVALFQNSPGPGVPALPRNSGQASSVSSRDAKSNSSHDDKFFDRPRKLSTATAATSTSNGSLATPTSPTFVFPGGRSRAPPKVAAPLNLSSLKLSGKWKRRSVGSDVERNQPARFMGIAIKKKKSDVEFRPATPPSPLAHTLISNSERSHDDYAGSQLGSTTSGGGPAGPEFEAYREQQMSSEMRRQERVRRIKSRIGSYPLDPYDTILLDNDRHTGDLLNRLNGTGCPSFHEYGSDPPATVLDLGCGQGHWVVDAAIAWRGYGTKVTGYDMVDISKVLLPWALKQGVADNIRFVRGNFLKQRLPFNDNSFDLVRMSSLTLCITADAWIFVFQEVCRILTVGGRLELVDDRIIFPYGKALTPSMAGLAAPSTPQLNMFAPRLDINIPSSAFTTFCIYDDADHPNPGLGFCEDDDGEDDLLELYQVKEERESDLDDTATLSGKEPSAQNDRATFQQNIRRPSVPRDRSRATQTSRRLRSWNKHAATSKDLESLFEHMLTHKFGIHMSPEDFVLDLMQDVFGHAREIRTMHLSLAPPDVIDDDAPRGRPDESSNKSHDRYGSFGSNFKHIPSPSPARTVRSGRMLGTPLSRSPGLILSPSTFIPMTQQELEIHASKHLRMLLSSKKFLVEHAMEATEDEEIDEDSVLEALWEYEGFLRARFNRPPDYGDDDKTPALSDSTSLRESIVSVSSDGQDAMWEYQSELRQRFAWSSDGIESSTATRSQIGPKVASSGGEGLGVPHARSRANRLNGAVSGRSSSPAGTGAPPYSRGEMAHVRTFRVYEAIKLDEAMLAMGLGA